jgi:hypothetical protein
MTPTAVLLLFLFSSILAGCITNDDLETIPPIIGASAEYITDDGTIYRINVLAPTRILHEDHTHREALVLEIKVNDDRRMDHRYYLDPTLHIVRMDALCSNEHDGHCYRHAIWQIGGELAPFGFGLPLIERTNKGLPFSAKGIAGHVEHTVVRNGAEITYGLTGGPVGPVGFTPTFGGDFLYETIDPWFPVHMTLEWRNGPITLTRTDREHGTHDWVQIQPFAFPDPIPWKDWQNDYFPAFDQAPLDDRPSYQEAYDALMDRSDTAREVIEKGGCLIGSWADSEGAGLWIRFIHEPTVATYHFVFLTAEGDPREWLVRWNTGGSILRSPSYQVSPFPREPHMYASVPNSCADAKRSPWPVIDHIQARDLIKDWPLGMRHDTLMVDWSLTHRSMPLGGTPEAGLHSLRFNWVPEWVPWGGNEPPTLMGQLRWDANRGFLEFAQLHRDDIDRLDAMPDLR